jgi:hypothetical protein
MFFILRNIVAWFMWMASPLRKRSRCSRRELRKNPLDVIQLPMRSDRADRIPLMLYPHKLAAWVFEDFTNMHSHELANATESEHRPALISTNNRRHAVASPQGRLLLCPISLTHIYWWDCVCIGKQPSAFSCVHLTQYLIASSDFRHPVTREDISRREISTIYRLLKRSGRSLLATRLVDTHEARHATRAAGDLQAEAVVAYDNSISLIMHDLLECMDLMRPLHGNVAPILAPLLQAARSSLCRDILAQYASYTRTVLREGAVAPNVVRAVLTNHSCIVMRIIVANTQFYDAHSAHKAIAFRATSLFAGLYALTFDDGTGVTLREPH